jgi:ComF family protein
MWSLLLQDCLICRQISKGLICSFCQQDITPFTTINNDKNLMLLPNVAKGLVHVDFTNLYAVCAYQWPISNLITALKFAAKLPHALALAELFVKHNIDENFNLPQAIIPIPLHNNRYLQRKYNQSYEICRYLTKLTQVQTLHSVLIRKNSTQAQTNLSAAQRKKNVNKAFKISSTSLGLLGQYQHIAVFDDVTTTGATANAAYRCLKQARPDLQIDIWSICVTLVR